MSWFLKLKEHYPVTAHAPNFDFRTGCCECKNICGTQFSRYLFSARSYMVNYVYDLVCLCFGIFGVKYFAYSYISVLFIRIRPSGL